MLKDELVENELVEHTDVIIKEADRLRDLVDNMLISSKRAIKYEKVNIHELTRGLERLLSRNISKFLLFVITMLVFSWNVTALKSFRLF